MDMQTWAAWVDEIKKIVKSPRIELGTLEPGGLIVRVTWYVGSESFMCQRAFSTYQLVGSSPEWQKLELDRFVAEIARINETQREELMPPRSDCDGALEASEMRAIGVPYCPVCYTFGHTHRKGCKYSSTGLDHHVTTK